MPEKALPIAPPRPIEGLVNLYRAYYDLLHRPMNGTVTITGTISDDTVKAVLINGVLELNLPPDTYSLIAELWNTDGATSSRTEVVELSRPA